MDLRQKMRLTINFQQFLTMIIKLINNAITDLDGFKVLMIMNSDGSAHLKFLKILEYKALDQLTLPMKLGDMDVIQKHIAHRYKTAKTELAESKARLNDLC